MYEDAKGAKYYVKEYKNPQQAMSEAAANSVYRKLGLEVPDSVVRVGNDGKTYFVSEWLDNLEGTLGNLGMTAADANKILDGFVADVFTMNWDAVGTGLDNVVRFAGGKIARIDQGGAFLFRAQGALKPASLLNKIGEWDSFVSKNPYYRQVFEKAGIKNANDLGKRAMAQIDDLIDLRLSYKSWDDFLKAQNPYLDASTRKQIAEMMDARYDLLLKKKVELEGALKGIAAKEADVPQAALPTKAGVQKILDKDKTYAEIWKRITAGEKAKDIAVDLDLNINNVYRIIRKLKKDNNDLSLSSIAESIKSKFKFWKDNVVRKGSYALEQEIRSLYSSYLSQAQGLRNTRSAIYSYTGGGYSAMNRALRMISGPEWTPRTKRLQKWLVNAPPPPDDLVVWRGTHTIGTSVTSKSWKAHKGQFVDINNIDEGDVLQLNGFQSTAIQPEKAWRHGGRTMLEIHPTCGAYVDIISANSGEKEFIIPHGQKFKVSGIKYLKFYLASRGEEITLKVVQLAAIGGCPPLGK